MIANINRESPSVAVKQRFANAFILANYPLLAIVTVLLSTGIAIPLLLAGNFGKYGSEAIIGSIGVMIIGIILFLSQDELAAVLVFAVSLFADWYLGLYIVS